MFIINLSIIYLHLLNILENEKWHLEQKVDYKEDTARSLFLFDNLEHPCPEFSILNKWLMVPLEVGHCHRDCCYEAHDHELSCCKVGNSQSS
jgi:hypothetical protein